MTECTLTSFPFLRDCGLVGEGEEAITMSAIKEEDGSQRLHFEVRIDTINDSESI